MSEDVLPTDWVAYRFGLLCANDRDRVIGGFELYDQAGRACLLIDLALLGRITAGADEVDIDTSPTGYPAADVMLEFIDRHPTGSVLEASIACAVNLTRLKYPSYFMDMTGDAAWLVTDLVSYLDQLREKCLRIAVAGGQGPVGA